jgi:hypothetical protein
MAQYNKNNNTVIFSTNLSRFQTMSRQAFSDLLSWVFWLNYIKINNTNGYEIFETPKKMCEP